jgi:hypothetical protein
MGEEIEIQDPAAATLGRFWWFDLLPSDGEAVVLRNV